MKNGLLIDGQAVFVLCCLVCTRWSSKIVSSENNRNQQESSEVKGSTYILEKGLRVWSSTIFCTVYLFIGALNNTHWTSAAKELCKCWRQKLTSNRFQSFNILRVLSKRDEDDQAEKYWTFSPEYWRNNSAVSYENMKIVDTEMRNHKLSAINSFYIGYPCDLYLKSSILLLFLFYCLHTVPRAKS